MTFVVIGGGPTGVELAGAIGEMANHTLKENFRHLDPADSKVILVESLPRILATFPPELSASAERSLQNLGVTVRTGAKVIDITAEAVTVENSTGTEQIHCRTVLWAAGVRASRLGPVLHERTGVEIDRRGRVKIQPDLNLPGHPEIFVIGDMTYLEQDGKPLPGVAQVAIQQGQHVARQILRQLENQPLVPFRYHDPGNMATIGRSSAVADLGWLKLSGFLAWVVWLVIHIINLIGFRNRISVLVQWIWNYFTYARSVRLIVGEGAPAPVLTEAALPPRQPAPVREIAGADGAAVRQTEPKPNYAA
jgi:NADH dehydrogenase